MWFQVVVFANLHRCLGQQFLNATMPLYDHYIYAVQDSRHPLTEHEKWKAEYLSGAEIYRLPTGQYSGKPTLWAVCSWQTVIIR